MGNIVIGILLMFAAASGDFVLRGTEGEVGRGLLAVAGLVVAGYGVSQVSNPRVICRVCTETLRRSEVEQHLIDEHDLVAHFRPLESDEQGFGKEVYSGKCECGAVRAYHQADDARHCHACRGSWHRPFEAHTPGYGPVSPYR
jgi:hypothetical protein